MAKNYLLEYSKQLATKIEMLCRNIEAPSNTLFRIRRSSGSVCANIREANYGPVGAKVFIDNGKMFCESKGGCIEKDCSNTLYYNFNYKYQDLSVDTLDCMWMTKK